MSANKLGSRAQLAESYTVSGWKLFWQRLNPFSYDRICRTFSNSLPHHDRRRHRLIETAKTASRYLLESAGQPIRRFRLALVDAIIDAGYRDAQHQLERCDPATRGDCIGKPAG